MLVQVLWGGVVAAGLGMIAVHVRLMQLAARRGARKSSVLFALGAGGWYLMGVSACGYAMLYRVIPVKVFLERVQPVVSRWTEVGAWVGIGALLLAGLLYDLESRGKGKELRPDPSIDRGDAG